MGGATAHAAGAHVIRRLEREQVAQRRQKLMVSAPPRRGPAVLRPQLEPHRRTATAAARRRLAAAWGGRDGRGADGESNCRTRAGRRPWVKGEV